MILIKMTRVCRVGVNKTYKETFSLSGARNCCMFSPLLSLNCIEKEGRESLQQNLQQ